MSLADLYDPLTETSLDYVAVTANWQTEVLWHVASVSGVLAEKAAIYTAPTNPDTIQQLTGLITGIGLPFIRADLASFLALPGVFPDPKMENVLWSSLVLSARGARKAPPEAYPALEMLVHLDSLIAGVDSIHKIVQVPGSLIPIEAVEAVRVLAREYVLPAIREKVGLR